MIVSAGISHSNCSMEGLSLFSKTHRQEEERTRAIIDQGIADEVVVLKTCNRYEIYMAMSSGTKGIRERLRSVFGDDCDMMEIRKGESAILHLFEVATTLDSMIIGEHQILGQVKKALERARENGTLGEELHSLFERAIRAGKRVRRETDLCQGNLPMASIAVKVAEERTGDLKGKNVLILGAGKISTMLAKIIQFKSPEAILVTNKRFERAQELSNLTGAKAIAYEIFKDHLQFVDMVFCASSAPHPLIYIKDLERATGLRAKDLTIVDIAMPPDVEVGANTIDGLDYIGMDTVRAYSRQMEEERKIHVPKARDIIAEEYEALKMQEQLIERKNIIREISMHVESIRQRELDRLLSDQSLCHEDIDAFSRAIVKRTLHNLFCNIQDLGVSVEKASVVRELMLKVREDRKEGVINVSKEETQKT